MHSVTPCSAFYVQCGRIVFLVSSFAPRVLSFSVAPMFRAGRRRMSDDASPQGGKAGRSEELRQRVAELQQQLETERSLRKQQHGEKVTPVASYASCVVPLLGA